MNQEFTSFYSMTRACPSFVKWRNILVLRLLHQPDDIRPSTDDPTSSVTRKKWRSSESFNLKYRRVYPTVGTDPLTLRTDCW